MKKITLIQAVLSIIIFVFVAQTIFAQKNKSDILSVYRINRKVEIPVTLGLFASHIYGYNYVKNKPGLDEDELNQLDANDIWKFDRIATEQDAAFRLEAHNSSDYFLNSSVLLPVLLGLDKNIRKDWVDLLVMYGETHAINSSIYLLSSSFIDRNRPLVYHPDVPLEDRTENGTRLSFFSGHVSTTAASTFFMAKVLSDYHPELGNKKYLLYGAALIPPAFVSYYRVKAMKHYPTDVITGAVIGATMGILVPHLHKNKKEKSKFSFVPLMGGVNGFKMCYTIR
ncbi:MAG: phosphatase PAP2 family protein [Bacteroidetes bacterium]|nr:phosphatase PAP2 family protein [Bacteroidota bacterium]